MSTDLLLKKWRKKKKKKERRGKKPTFNLQSMDSLKSHYTTGFPKQELPTLLSLTEPD